METAYLLSLIQISSFLRKLAFFIVWIIFLPLKGQIVIDTSYTPEDLIKKVLLDDKNGILIRNIKYKGSKQSFAKISNIADEFPLQEGILISTGNVFDALGPNSKADAGRRTSAMRDRDLQSIATGAVFDAAYIEFELLSLKDSISFEYVFASEEYPEYVDKGVNDIFAFFLFELDSRAIFPQNIAIVPNTRTPVTIDNVNHKVNSEYFLRSDYLDAQTDGFWNQNPEMFYRAAAFEFDGFTSKLEAKKKLKTGKWYRLKIAISDVGDGFYDSVVILKAKSMKSKGDEIPEAKTFVNDYIKSNTKLESEGDSEGNLSVFSLIVQFDSNEDIIKRESYKDLIQLAEIMKNGLGLELEIVGHTDNVGSDSDNLNLSKRRALSVQRFLEEEGVKPELLKSDGKGESMPKESNETEIGRYKNRRVEFKFYLP